MVHLAHAALGIGAAVLLVLTNAFFVATEFAVARIRPSQVRELEEDHRPGARSLRHAVDHIDAYLAACQLGITLASLGLGAIAKPAFEALLQAVVGPAADFTGLAATAIAFGLAFGIVTLLHVVAGELAPKSVAISRTVRIALLVAPPMRAFYLAARPVVNVLNGLGNALLKPFGIPPAREVGHTPHSEDELRILLQESQLKGLIDEEERLLADRALMFGDLRARQVMVPRGEIAFLTSDLGLHEAARSAGVSGHSYLPLCEPGGLDDPIGVASTRELLLAALSDQGMEPLTLVRPIKKVSESLLVDELLAELRGGRERLALVVDEFGTTIGLVTVEDVLEEIVGELDEQVAPAGDGLVDFEGDPRRMPGSTRLSRLAAVLGLEVESDHEATIGGHVLAMLGHMPRKGECVQLDGYELEVVDSHDGQVQAIRLARSGLADGASGGRASQSGTPWTPSPRDPLREPP